MGGQIEDSSVIPPKIVEGSYSGILLPPFSVFGTGSSLDLGRFIFPGVASAAGPSIVGSGHFVGGPSSCASKHEAERAQNLLKNPAPQKTGVSSHFPPRDLRDAVSRETWDRFPEAVWKDAAEIVSEILKLSKPGGLSVLDHPPPGVEGADGSASSSFWEEAAKLADRLEVNPAGGECDSAPQNIQGMSDPISASVLDSAHADPLLEAPVGNPTVPPTAIPVSPVEPLSSGPDPKAPSFADLVSKGSSSIENIGTTDFSGPLPTAVFTKEECEIVSAVYKNALIGKFSYGKPDNFAIANSLFNAGYGNCKVQFLNFKHIV
ncbi:hypothetical protein OROMI_021140 [Orobanche minor]